MSRSFVVFLHRGGQFFIVYGGVGRLTFIVFLLTKGGGVQPTLYVRAIRLVGRPICLHTVNVADSSCVRWVARFHVV